MKDNELRTDVSLAFLFYGISVAILTIVLLVTCGKVKELNNTVNDLTTQVEDLQEDNQFLKDHYEEEIVMLDSQLLLLESEIVEMRDGVELIKK